MLGKLLSTYLTVFESSSEKFTGKRLLQNNNTIPLVINWKHNNHIMACVFEIPLSCKSVFINFKVFFLRFSHVDTSTELAYFANVINLLLQYGGRTQHHTRVSKQTKGVHYSINRQGIGDKYPKETDRYYRRRLRSSIFFPNKHLIRSFVCPFTFPEFPTVDNTQSKYLTAKRSVLTFLLA